MASNVNILANIMEDGTQSTALNWIKRADTDTDYSGWRNRYGETIAQLGVIPQIDMPKVVIELIKKMDKKSLDNRDDDNNCLVTSSIYYQDLFQSLMRTDVEMYTNNTDGISSFALLAELGYLALMINLRVKYKFTINDEGNEGDSALVLSAMNNKASVVDYLLKNDIDLEDHFVGSWGKEYLKNLKDYKRVGEYVELFIKHDLMELVPEEVKDIFVF